MLAGGIEAALGGALLALFGNDAGGVRAVAQARSPSISSVAAISRFSGRSISAISRSMSASVMWRRSSRRWAVMPSAPAAARELGGAHRIGMVAAARVADGRDVVDVDAEAERRAGHSATVAAPRLDRPGWRPARAGARRPRRSGTSMSDQREEGHAEVDVAAGAVDHAAAATTLPPAASIALIASRDDRPVVTTSSTISDLRAPGSSAKPRRSSKIAVRPLDEHRVPSERAAHFVADDHAAHRRRDDASMALRGPRGQACRPAPGQPFGAGRGPSADRAHCR